MRTLAWQARWRGDFDLAELLAHRAIARLKGEGAESAIADTLSTLGVIHVSRGRRDLARECIEEGFEVLSTQPNVATRVDLLTALAMAERHGRRLHQAQEAMREAVALSIGAERAQTEQSVARALLYDDRPGEALEHALMSIELAREHRNQVIIPFAMEIAAGAQIDLDNLETARDLLKEARSLMHQKQQPRVTCNLIFQEVRLHQRLDEPEAALECARRGKDIADGTGYVLMQIRFLDRIADLQEAGGHTKAALRTLKEMVALREAERE